MVWGCCKGVARGTIARGKVGAHQHFLVNGRSEAEDLGVCSPTRSHDHAIAGQLILWRGQGPDSVPVTRRRGKQARQRDFCGARMAPAGGFSRSVGAGATGKTRAATSPRRRRNVPKPVSWSSRAHDGAGRRRGSLRPRAEAREETTAETEAETVRTSIDNVEICEDICSTEDNFEVVDEEASAKRSLTAAIGVGGLVSIIVSILSSDLVVEHKELALSAVFVIGYAGIILEEVRGLPDNARYSLPDARGHLTLLSSFPPLPPAAEPRLQQVRRRAHHGRQPVDDPHAG